MSSSKTLIHGLLFLTALSLTACQMPVKPNKQTTLTKAPEAESEPILTESLPVAPTEAADEKQPDPLRSPDTAAATVLSGSDRQTGAVVFSRLSDNFSGPICKDTAAVIQWKKRYAGNPKAFSRHLEEILPLLDYVSAEVERRDLPAEFALIPIIESWYQPGAIGVGGPAGLWQMIGTTAKNHGIKIQPGYDGRLSVVDSTDAALSYLGTLQGMFKDWQRAVMGYNAGEFRVLRAIKKSGNKSEGEDHWPHGLSNITYAYIAKVQALSCLISHPEKNNLSLPASREFTPLAAVLVGKNAGSLDNIAKRHGIDPENLKKYNPAYKHGNIAANTPRRVLLPAYLGVGTISDAHNDASEDAVTADKLDPNTEALETHAGSYQVKNGDTLWSVAKRYGLSLVDLRKLNGLNSKSILRVGQTLKLSASVP